MFAVVRLVFGVAGLFACGKAIVEPNCLEVLNHACWDGLICGVMLGSTRVAVRLSKSDRPLAVLTSKLTVCRFVFDVKIGLASGALLGITRVLLYSLTC